MTSIGEEPFGPNYPPMPGLNKYRTAAAQAGGVAKLDPILRKKYGAAIEKAIRAMQRAAMAKVYVMPAPRCASGSWANTAEGIEKAVRARQASELAAAARRDREGRSDETIQALYDQAMRGGTGPSQGPAPCPQPVKGTNPRGP